MANPLQSVPEVLQRPQLLPWEEPVLVKQIVYHASKDVLLPFDDTVLEGSQHGDHVAHRLALTVDGLEGAICLILHIGSKRLGLRNNTHTQVAMSRHDACR